MASVLFWGLDVPGGLPGVIGVDHREVLSPEALLHDGPLSLLEGWLEDIVLIWVDRTLDHVFPEPIGGGDEDHILKAGLGVNGEDHPRRGLIGSDHLLHRNGEVHIELAKALIVAVGDGAVGKEARKAALAGVN